MATPVGGGLSLNDHMPQTVEISLRIPSLRVRTRRDGHPRNHQQQRHPIQQADRGRFDSEGRCRADDGDQLWGNIRVRRRPKRLASQQEHVRHCLPLLEALRVTGRIPCPDEFIRLASQSVDVRPGFQALDATSRCTSATMASAPAGLGRTSTNHRLTGPSTTSGFAVYATTGRSRVTVLA